MNRSLVAGAALLAGIAIAAPPLARPADSQTQPDQATPVIPPMGHAAAGDARMGGMPDHPGMDMMARHGRMREMMMHRMMRRSPAERCGDRLARRAAMVAYTVTKLNLTAEQRPLWDKLNAIVQAGTEKQQHLCAALKAGPPPGQRTILDRTDWLEQTLAARAQSLQQARPALEQLYKALTPEQKAIIDHPFRRG
jgi:LTXXQ motif family protein